MTVSKAAMPILILSLLSRSAFSDDINCQSEFGNVTLEDDVVIAAPCTLNGTKVDGKITIFAGGSLTAVGAKIEGNIKARDADFLDLQNSDVDGNIDLRDMVGDTINIRDNVVEGRIILKRNRSRLYVHDNYIAEKLEAEENSGGIVITENVIDDDLECRGNSPEPNGNNNQVAGKRQGQCRNLEAVDLPAEPEDGGPTTEPEDEGPAPPPTSTSGESNQPPLELNTGTGGGASFGPQFLICLFTICLCRLRQRVN